MGSLTVNEWIAVISVGANVALSFITMQVKTEVMKLRAEFSEAYLSKSDFDRLTRLQKEH